MNQKDALKLLHKMEEVRRVDPCFRGISYIHYWYGEGGAIIASDVSHNIKLIITGLPESNFYELVKKTKTVRFWKFVGEYGSELERYYTEDREWWYNGQKVRVFSDQPQKTKWIKTNCFIDVEVEE